MIPNLLSWTLTVLIGICSTNDRRARLSGRSDRKLIRDTITNSVICKEIFNYVVHDFNCFSRFSYFEWGQYRRDLELLWMLIEWPKYGPKKEIWVKKIHENTNCILQWSHIGFCRCQSCKDRLCRCKDWWALSLKIERCRNCFGW